MRKVSLRKIPKEILAFVARQNDEFAGPSWPTYEVIEECDNFENSIVAYGHVFYAPASRPNGRETKFAVIEGPPERTDFFAILEFAEDLCPIEDRDRVDPRS